MKIWVFNNYCMLPEHGVFNRSYHFCLNLKKMGCEPIAFVGSHPHNTDLQLIDGKETFKVYQKEPFPWVLIKICKYKGDRKLQIVSMFQYYINARKASKHFQNPDVILGSSGHPLAPLLAVHLGKKYKCKKIVEMRDLWPQSLVEYGFLKDKSFVTSLLRKFEHYLYVNADEIIFTQENAYEYIEERGWQKDIPKSKVHYINNGVNRELFYENKEKYHFEDVDLDNDDIFKVVYTGSVKKVNNLSLLLDVAKEVKNPKVKFLIWGDGNEIPLLQKRIDDENITNVVFKGFVEKKYIPGILDRADLTYAHNNPTPVFRYGISFNKIFDYFAAEKPVLCDFPAKNNPVVTTGAGVSVETLNIKDVAKKIDEFSYMSKDELKKFCINAKKAAEEYDFENLTKKLSDVIMND